MSTSYRCPKCGSTDLETVGVATFDLDGESGSLSSHRGFEGLPETYCSCKECNHRSNLGRARDAALKDPS
jgi:DNA-directed RNA polymerase subunit RPC12/RpoP